MNNNGGAISNPNVNCVIRMSNIRGIQSGNIQYTKFSIVNKPNIVEMNNILLEYCNKIQKRLVIDNVVVDNVDIGVKINSVNIVLMSKDNYDKTDHIGMNLFAYYMIQRISELFNEIHKTKNTNTNVINTILNRHKDQIDQMYDKYYNANANYNVNLNLIKTHLIQCVNYWKNDSVISNSNLSNNLEKLCKIFENKSILLKFEGISNKYTIFLTTTLLMIGLNLCITQQSEDKIEAEMTKHLNLLLPQNVQQLKNFINSNNNPITPLSEKKKIIVTSGDCSDFDGFLALPIYYKAAVENKANIYFMMTYPKYLNPHKIHTDKSTDKNEMYDDKDIDGLGYNYGFDYLLQTWTNSNPEQIIAISNILRKNDNINNTDYQTGMRDITVQIIKHIWSMCNSLDLSHKPNIYIVDNNYYNTFNPFSSKAIKNEVFVYGSVLFKSPPIDSQYVKVIDQDTFINDHCKNSNEIYMDMNGSMAWYTNEISKEFKNEKIKCCVVMGGVEPELGIDTLSSIPTILDRLSTATMNQLYHVAHTSKFFSEHSNKCIFVTNNAINKHYNWTASEISKDFKNDIRALIQKMLQIENDFITPIEDLFDAYYEPKKGREKPFDLISAYELYKYMKNDRDYKDAYLYVEESIEVSPSYGITLIFESENLNNKDDINKILRPKLLEKIEKLDGDEQNQGKILGIQKELGILNVITYTKYKIQVPSKYEFTKEKPQQIGSGGRGVNKRRKKTMCMYTKTDKTYTDIKGITRVLYEKRTQRNGNFHSYIKVKNSKTNTFKYKKVLTDA